MKYATKIVFQKILNNRLSDYLTEKNEWSFDRTRKMLNRKIDKVMDDFKRHKREFEGVENIEL
jgi:hypothetical protein